MKQGGHCRSIAASEMARLTSIHNSFTALTAEGPQDEHDGAQGEEEISTPQLVERPPIALSATQRSLEHAPQGLLTSLALTAVADYRCGFKVARPGLVLGVAKKSIMVHQGVTAHRGAPRFEQLFICDAAANSLSLPIADAESRKPANGRAVRFNGKVEVKEIDLLRFSVEGAGKWKAHQRYSGRAPRVNPRMVDISKIDPSRSVRSFLQTIQFANNLVMEAYEEKSGPHRHNDSAAPNARVQRKEDDCILGAHLPRAKLASTLTSMTP